MFLTMNSSQRFMEQGYWVVPNVLDPIIDLQPLKDDYAHLLEQVAERAFQAGIIPDRFAEFPFETRMGKLLSTAQTNLFKAFDICLPNEPLTEDSPHHLSEAIFNLLRNPRILDAVELLIGGEIYSNPIQHVRIKPPQAVLSTNRLTSTLVRTTGWHQDQGVSREVADQTEMITVWVAITDATLENGCLQVIPYSHREGMSVHCPSDEMTIPPHLLNGEPLPVPLKAGDALILHRLTKHASLPNISSGIRWSFDLRYQPIGQPTGRDELPGFVARSRNNPAQELHDYAEWVARWQAAKARLVAQSFREKTHRWNSDAPACA
jgi:hypothetical protein